MESNQKYYAVVKGHIPGIYDTWEVAKEHVSGFPGSLYKRFPTQQEAQEYYQEQLQRMQEAQQKIQKENISALETLTSEQSSVLHQLLLGHNVGLLGAAGCGKSYLLSVIYTEFPGLKKKWMHHYSPGTLAKLPRIQMCALTGCAALLLGHKAKTLHSWAGIGLGKGTVSELCSKIRRNAKAKRNWLCTDLLIIDEVSMLTGELLDKLNEIGQKIRANHLPFGGIQVVLVGDFYQLPPVNKGEEAVSFAFESRTWKEAIHAVVELTIIQRQKDQVFQKLLMEARSGTLSKESCDILRACQERDWKTHKIRPTLLFPRRAEVNMINDSNLRALKGRHYTYSARFAYDGKIPDGFTEKDEGFIRAQQMFDSNAPYDVTLELALNAQVMLIANIEPELGLVNGSRGVIVEFCPQTELPIVEFVNGMRKMIGTHHWPIEDYEFVSRIQVPLRLAFACTIHRSQGATIDATLVDIGSSVFEYGQAYVALSRVRTLEALYVHDFDPTAFKTHPKVATFYNHLQPVETLHNWMSFLNISLEEEKEDVKPIVSTPSKVIQAIHVSKQDEQGNELVSESEPGTSVHWLYDSIPDGWRSCFSSCKDKLCELSTFLDDKSFLPKREQIWTSLALTPLHSVKVVILGQDPYPTPGNSMGLAFSVEKDVRPLPASLKNIYKELVTDVGFVPPAHGSLEEWARRGVLLLNTVLTVEAGTPQSHSKIGWEEVTDQIIRSVAAQQEGVVFVLWGKSAQAKKKLLDLYLHKNKHRVFESAHPSPLSSHRGFFGSRPFSTVNTWLKEMGKEEINWQIT